MSDKNTPVVAFVGSGFERKGAFREFCIAVGRRTVTEFNYRLSGRATAHLFVGVATQSRDEREGKRHAHRVRLPCARACARASAASRAPQAWASFQLPKADAASRTPAKDVERGRRSATMPPDQYPTASAASVTVMSAVQTNNPTPN